MTVRRLPTVANYASVTYLYTATAGQTTFSGVDGNGLTLSYVVGTEQVYLNGVLQVRGSDYTASNGTSIVLASAAIVSDILNVVTYSNFSLSTDIPKSTLSAKGALISASAASTPAALAVGADGSTLVANSAAATGLAWASNFSAGKNKIINGDFRFNQRNFTSNTATASYGFDRWFQLNSGGTVTVTPQVFTPGTAPVAGYEGTNFVRIVSASQSASGNYAAVVQNIESVRTLAGQSATVSFWAKASTGTPNVGLSFEQSFGSGGSPSSTVVTTVAKQTITSSWARYSFSVNVPSLSGKTIGTNNDNSLGLLIFTSCGSGVTGYSTDVGLQNVTIDFWGVQVEAGSTATAFQTATGTIQGELAACQRYYFRNVSGQFTSLGIGNNTSTTAANIYTPYPVTMRIAPTGVEQTGTAGDYRLSHTTATTCSSVPVFTGASTVGGITTFTVASGLTSGGAAQAQPTTTIAYLGWSAEL